MKLFLGSFVFGLVTFTVASSAGAVGMTYDCDTAAGHFSELDLPAPPAPFTVTGSVQINALARDGTYAPITRVQIAAAAAPGQSPPAYAGFSLSALPADPKKTPSGAPAIQMLSYNTAGKEDEVLPLSTVTKPGTVQPFRLSYDGSNVSVSLGNDAKTIAMRTATPVVRIVCSTGEFLLTDVVIQSAR